MSGSGVAWDAMWWLMMACWSAGEPEGPDRVNRFNSEPDVVIAEVLAMTDPVAQEVAVLELCEAWPGYTSTLCAALPEGAARSRCDRFNARPHLWSIEQNSTSASWSGGVSSGRLGLPAAFLQTWSGAAAAAGECAGSDHACLEAAAQGSA